MNSRIIALAVAAVVMTPLADGMKGGGGGTTVSL